MTGLFKIRPNSFLLLQYVYLYTWGNRVVDRRAFWFGFCVEKGTALLKRLRVVSEKMLKVHISYRSISSMHKKMLVSMK